MKQKFIPVTGPSITQKEIKYVSQAAKDGWNENHTKYVDLFEKRFSSYVGRKYALATSSCTGAIHLACLALGIGKGDEVIVPNITWIASVEPLYYVGARPVFVDIDPETWCIDPASIENNITKKTKAILVVDLYGNIPDMKLILQIARKHNLKIIEDAAEAVGSEYHGRRAGGFGDVSCFSFHGSKALVTGEGGMLLANSKRVIEKARYFNDHCKHPSKAFWNLGIGYKYKMSNFQAACGLAQLERVNELISKKRKIFSWYKQYLADLSGVQLNAEPPHTKNTYWMITVIVDRKFHVSKENLIKKLYKRSIQARPVFYPLSSLPAINRKANTPVSFDISRRGINLPCGQNIAEKEVKYVCNSLKEVFKV